MYSRKAMDHFLKPRHAGVLAAGAGVGQGAATNADCGDTALVSVRLQDGRVQEARFQSKGCAGAVAACSAATEWLLGKDAAAAEAISPEAIEAWLDGLPPAKRGCSTMAAQAARTAVQAARG